MRVFSLKNGFTLMALLLGVFPLLMFLLIAPHLPQSVPIQFGLGNSPDRWAAPLSRETLLLASLGIAGFLLMKVMQIMVVLPLKGAGRDDVSRMFNVFTLAVTALFSACSLYAQFWMQSQGNTFDLAFYISAPCIVAGMLFVGATHFMSGAAGRGKVMKYACALCGTLIMMFSVIPYSWSFILIGASLAVMLLWPLLYSLSQKSKQQEEAGGA